MIFFHSNIKLLRTRKKRSQEELAGALDLKISTLSSHELGTVEPGLEKVVKYANFFKISLDELICKDLSTISEFELSQMEKGFRLAQVNNKS